MLAKLGYVEGIINKLKSHKENGISNDDEAMA
jgi:hypothetical protein